MKKILFATTALVASAGIASAEIAFSGSAQGGIAKGVDTSDAAAPVITEVYSFADFEVKMTGTADNGLTFGATISATSGEKYDIGDFEFDGAKGGAFDFDGVFVEYGGAKLTLDQGGIDNLYDDDFESHDAQFDYSMSGFSIALTVSDNPTAGAAEFSYKLAYSANGFGASLTGDDNEENMVVDVNYSGDNYKVGVAYDQKGAASDETKIYGEFSTNGVKVTASVIDGKADGETDWDLGISYTMNALSLAVETDEESEWELTGSYDFGGGLSAVAGVNHADAYYAGLKMSF